MAHSRPTQQEPLNYSVYSHLFAPGSGPALRWTGLRPVTLIRMTVLPPALRAVRTVVGTRLAHVLGVHRARWADASPASDDLLDAAEALVSSGKRMRAVLGAVGLALGTPGAGAPERDGLMTGVTAARLGAALELYQASALVHDDVIDAALTRRGLPAAHRRYAAQHAASSWRGDATTYGGSAAILLGDLLMSLAGAEMGAAVESLAGGVRAAPARDAFDAMTAEVAVGQFLDVRSEVTSLPSPDADPAVAGQAMLDSALAVLRRKSARYSVMHPLLIGALLGGATTDSPLYAALRTFGEEVGIAFQLRDDVLGVYGDPDQTGKPAGDDLREGKRTVLLAMAWRRTDRSGRVLLSRVLANRDASSGMIAAASDLIRDCGALAAHEEEIAARARTGLRALDDAPPGALDEVGRADLSALARALTARDA